MKKQAFTLVELIVVITILAILATIGFVSFSGYLAGTRDTNRIAQLKSMSDALELYRTKKDLPIPDDKVDVQASGTTIAYQGYIGANVLETIEYTEKGLDPKDKVYFSYYLTKSKKYFQLLSFLEEANTDVVASNIFNNSQAVDYTNRFPKVIGKKLGILTDGENTPIQEIAVITSSGYLDIVTTNNNYTANLSDDKNISGTGVALAALEGLSNLGGTLTKAKGKSCKAILDTYGKLIDGMYEITPKGSDPFQVYCDMTTDGGGWTLVANQPTYEDNWGDFVWDNVDGTSFYGIPGLDEKYFVPLAYWNDMGNNSFSMKVIGENKVSDGTNITYDTTLVHLETDKYKLVVVGANPSANVFRSGYNFTTSDSDNDVWANNCASTYNSPWWYTSCHGGTPLGGNWYTRPNSLNGSTNNYNQTMFFIR